MLYVERYITDLKQWKLRNALTRFRTSCHDLNIAVGRDMNVDREFRYCNFCLQNNATCIEDEFHFLFICPRYNAYRRANKSPITLIT